MSGARRGLAVLEHLVNGDGAPTHGALAQATGLPKSTLTNVLAELIELEYVAPHGRAYAPGSRLLTLGYRITQRLGLPARAPSTVHDALVQLARDTGETAIFAVEVGATAEHAGSVLALDYVESPHPMRYVPGIGDLQPIEATAAGAVLLAFSGRDASVVTPADAERLDAELRRTRERGYALNDSAVEGVTSIAAPWIDGTGRLIGAISIVGPTQRLRDAQATIARTVRAVLDRDNQPLGS